MPLTQQDAERIGANIGSIFGFGEKRKARLETEALKRRADAELIVQQYLAEKAMERLKEQEAGDDRRAKLAQDREDGRERTRVGVMSDNAQIAADQRMEAARLLRDQQARAEANRMLEDEATRAFEQQKWADTRPLERMKTQAAFGNMLNQAREAGYQPNVEDIGRAGFVSLDNKPKEEEAGMFDWIFGSKPKPTNQPIFQSKKVQPSTGAAPPPTTPTPMPPTAEGTR